MHDFIYNQNCIPRQQWRYGLRPSSATGCGWIAVYNALKILGYRVEIEPLIRYLEAQLPLIHGNFGTSFWAPCLCFRHWGFPVEMSANRSRFDEISRKSDACILFYYWRAGLKIGAHFAALRIQDGQVIGYNTFRNSQGPDLLGTSLETFLKNHKYFGCILMGIQEREQPHE